jgi:hypothetical protein
MCTHNRAREIVRDYSIFVNMLIRNNMRDYARARVKA